MSLSVEIHETFLRSVFSASQECGKNPRTLLKEISENSTLYEFEGWVIQLDEDGPLSLTDELGAVDDALMVWSVKFANDFPSSVPYRNVRWSTVSKFATFYHIWSSNLTISRLPRPSLNSNMSLDDIIVEKDVGVLHHVDILSRHFLDLSQQNLSLFWVDQFNEEENLYPNPHVDHQEEGEIQEDQSQPFDTDLVFYNTDDVTEQDANHILNELVQERQEGDLPYHITIQSAKDSLKEIQTIIDDEVKDLIPEGTYLKLMNKMQEAFDRI